MDERETGYIRAGYVLRRHYLADLEDAEKEFDAWLAAHDREMAAKALEDAAYEFAVGAWAGAFIEGNVEDDESAVRATEAWFKARAAALRSAPPTETTEGGTDHA